MIDLKKINKIHNDIIQNVDCIKNSVDDLKKIICEYDNKSIKKNPFIVKRVVKHLANGLSKHNAIALTATELNESTDRVSMLFSQQKTYMSALHLFSKKYLCEKMRNAGYSAKQISIVLNISENHVYKLLKSVPNEWILKNF